MTNTVLFYAINGIGLGHVVRMSSLCRSIKGYWPDVKCFYYSNSPVAGSFFDCDGLSIPDNLADPLPRRIGRFVMGLGEALAAFRPSILVCDSHWPQPYVGNLRARGMRTVVVLDAASPGSMLAVLQKAREDFDQVIIPHQPEELMWLYGRSAATWAALSAPEVTIVGPVARTAPTPSEYKQIIFTLGAGGEYFGANERNTVSSFFEAFIHAANILSSHGIDISLAEGSLLPSSYLKKWPYRLLKTNNLHLHLGPKTVLVGRPGYNTCWEAIAARSGLVLCGDHATPSEDTGLRADFLARNGLARKVETEGPRIALAVLDWLERSARDSRMLSVAVNCGLELAAETILDRGGLRDRSASSPPVKLNPTFRNSGPGHIDAITKEVSSPSRRIARFSPCDGELSNMEADLLNMARLLGFRVQIHFRKNQLSSLLDKYKPFLDFGGELWLALDELAGDETARIKQKQEWQFIGISVANIHIAEQVVVQFPHLKLGLTFPYASIGAETTVRLSAQPGWRVINELRIWSVVQNLQTIGIPTGLAIDLGRDSFSAAAFHLQTLSRGPNLHDSRVG